MVICLNISVGSHYYSVNYIDNNLEICSFFRMQLTSLFNSSDTQRIIVKKVPSKINWTGINPYWDLELFYLQKIQSS